MHLSIGGFLLGKILDISEYPTAPLQDHGYDDPVLSVPGKGLGASPQVWEGEAGLCQVQDLQPFPRSFDHLDNVGNMWNLHPGWC